MFLFTEFITTPWNDVYPFRFINPEGIRNETIAPGRVFLEKQYNQYSL